MSFITDFFNDAVICMGIIDEEKEMENLVRSLGGEKIIVKPKKKVMINPTEKLLREIFANNEFLLDDEVRDVIFNDKATIVFWNDGTKTKAICQEGDVFSKETGLAICLAKKFLNAPGYTEEIAHLIERAKTVEPKKKTVKKTEPETKTLEQESVTNPVKTKTSKKTSTKKSDK